jgi:hypothetical protein
LKPHTNNLFQATVAFHYEFATAFWLSSDIRLRKDWLDDDDDDGERKKFDNEKYAMIGPVQC